MKLHAPLKTIAPRIQSGDLLLWSGRRVVDRAIAIATRSPYTHAGMAVRQGNVVLVAEMAFSGGRAIDLVSQVRDSPGQWEWRPVASNFNFNRKGAAAVMMHLVQKPYGRSELTWAALRHVPIVRCFFAPRNDDDLTAEGISAPPFCSDAMSIACQFGGGEDPVWSRPARLTEPDDLACSRLWNARQAAVLWPSEQTAA